MFSQPFTMVDRKGSVWTVATDKIWFVAAQGQGTAPRFKGDSQALFAMLNILHYDPRDGVALPTKVGVDNHVCSVLGVTVSTKRFEDLLAEAPSDSRLCLSSGIFPGIPGIGIFADGWRALLMGFANVTEEVPVVDLTPPLSLFDLAMGME